MNATRILTVVLGAVLVVAVGCKNSKYCDDGGNPCTAGMTCNTTTHACVVGGGGAGGAGGKTDGGAGAGGKTDGGTGGKAGTGGSGGHLFRCDASTQCSAHNDGAAPICELDGASCVGCVKDKDCKKDAPICQNNKCVSCSANSQCGAHDAGFPFCSADSGACIECTTSTDCTSPTKPICNTSTSTCVPCTADSQCTAKSTSGPGICMFQGDGHCATDAESVYVQPSANTCVPSAIAGGGSSAMPFCHLSDAISSISTRDLIVLRGGSIAGGVTIQNPAMLSIVGQNSSAGMTVDSGQSGLHIVGGDLYVRGVEIVGVSASATIGIVVDTNATIRLDGVSVENMPQGGLRVVGSGYDVVNAILEGNGGTLDDSGRLIGGAFLGAPPAGLPSRFAFNTIVSNKEAGVLCVSAVQTVDASLLAANLGGGGTPDYSGCTLSSSSKAFGTAAPGLTATYRLMMTSPCVDFVATPPMNPPLHDIDGVTRPQGIAFDCGASEYKPQ